MIERVLVPQAFENMEEATLGAWRKREGDIVRPGEALCELITEKTTFDLPAEIAGEATLLHLAAPEKSVLPVHAVLALVGPSSAPPGDLQLAIEAAARENEALLQKRGAPAPDEAPALSVPSLRVPALGVPGAGASASPASTSGASGAAGARLRATPAARRAAKELGVELEDVARRSPGKVLSEEDVRTFATG